MESHYPRSDAPLSPTLESLPVEPLLTSEFDSNPGVVHARLRHTYGPVAPVGLAGVPVWLVLGYQEVLEVLRNEAVWRKDIRHWRARAEGRLPQDWPLLPGYEVRQMMFMDGEEHKEARLTFHRAIAPFQDGGTRQGRQLQSAVAQYADELVGMLVGEGGATGFLDLSAQYTRPLVLMILNRLFGFPVEQGDDVVMDIWRMLDGGPDGGEATGRALNSMTWLAGYRRARPGEDLTSYMIAADPRLTDEQLGRELFRDAVYIADVTGNMLSNTLLEVLRGNTSVRASVSGGMYVEALNQASLSNPSVANMTFRFPVHDVPLGNFVIGGGDIVLPSIAAAHSDPLFASGDMDGTVHSTRAHLAWGAGAHQCPGLARDLATMIVSVSVERLFAHLGKIELSLPVDQLPWRSGPVVRGLRLLPVRYELRDSSALSLAAARPDHPTAGRAAAGAPRGGPLSVLRRMMARSRRSE